MKYMTITAQTQPDGTGLAKPVEAPSADATAETETGATTDTAAGE